MITCQLQLPLQIDREILMEIPDNKLNITKWKRNDNGNLDYWQPMQHSLDFIFNDGCDFFQINRTNDVNELVNNFVQNINSALFTSLRINDNKSLKTKRLIWNNEIFKLRSNNKLAYQKWKFENNELIKADLWNNVRFTKKQLNYAIRKEERKKLKSLIQDT